MTGKPLLGRVCLTQKQKKHMHKDLQTLVSVYTRYINSLKAEGADTRGNYTKMKEYINNNSPIWLKGHMLQDCYVNCLRAYHKKPLEASYIIKLLMDTNCSDETLTKAQMQLSIVTKDKPTEYRNSCLPTLYKYFRPSNEEELEYMKAELEKMKDKGLISPSDYWSVKELVLKTVEKTKNYITKDTEQTKGLKIQAFEGDQLMRALDEELEEELAAE